MRGFGDDQAAIDSKLRAHAPTSRLAREVPLTTTLAGHVGEQVGTARGPTASWDQLLSSLRRDGCDEPGGGGSHITQTKFPEGTDEDRAGMRTKDLKHAPAWMMKLDAV